MDVLRAAYLVAHEFKPDGAVSLAKKMGVSPGTFSNEVNPEQETHKLGLGRAVAMTTSSQDFRILHAFADTCSHLAIPKPDFSQVSDKALLDLFLERDRRIGEFAETIEKALDDGEVSKRDADEINDAAYALAASVLELAARLKGLCNER